MEIDNFLAHINQKVDLTKEEEAILVAKIKTRTYLKSQYISQQGDVYRYQTFILSGVIRTFHLDNNGNENIVAFGIENWWVGDICSFSTQTPAEFNTQCLEKTSVAQINYETMEQLFVESPYQELRTTLFFLKEPLVLSAKSNMKRM